MSNQQPDVQTLYSQYQNAVRQLQMYEQQEMQIMELIDEMYANLNTIAGLKKFPEGSERIIPLGGIVLLKANLRGIKEILVDIGSDVVIPSSLEDAENALNTRVKEMENLVEKLQSDKQQLEQIVEQLRSQLNQFSQ